MVSGLRQIELPLAFPVILTGIRIVLVQNIGLANRSGADRWRRASGWFVFQGIGQTALDLVLLGAVPNGGAGRSPAGAILDAVVEMVTPGRNAPHDRDRAFDQDVLGHDRGRRRVDDHQ